MQDVDVVIVYNCRDHYLGAGKSKSGINETSFILYRDPTEKIKTVIVVVMRPV